MPVSPLVAKIYRNIKYCLQYYKCQSTDTNQPTDSNTRLQIQILITLLQQSTTQYYTNIHANHKYINSPNHKHIKGVLDKLKKATRINQELVLAITKKWYSLKISRTRLRSPGDTTMITWEHKERESEGMRERIRERKNERD